MKTPLSLFHLSHVLYPVSNCSIWLNQQHKSIIGALKAAPEWEFEQIDFVVGSRGSVVESDFYTKLKKLDIQEGKKDKLFADRSAQSGDCVLHPVGARRYEANSSRLSSNPCTARGDCALHPGEISQTTE